MFLLPSTTTRLLHWQSVLRGQVWKGKQDDPTRKKDEDSVYTAASQLLKNEKPRPNRLKSAAYPPAVNFERNHLLQERIWFWWFFLCVHLPSLYKAISQIFFLFLKNFFIPLEDCLSQIQSLGGVLDIWFYETRTWFWIFLSLFNFVKTKNSSVVDLSILLSILIRGSVILNNGPGSEGANDYGSRIIPGNFCGHHLKLIVVKGVWNHKIIKCWIHFLPLIFDK
jgi:hypothetical protein